MKKILLTATILTIALNAYTFKELKIACDSGTMKSCNKVGMMYENGEGVEQDDFRAMKYYIMACKGGNGNACFYAGVNYYKGKGALQDLNESQEYFGKACDYEDARGCENYAMIKMGQMVTIGLGMSKTEKQEKACNAGNMTACHTLGEGYKKIKNYDKAFKYLSMACEDKDISCNSLADLYEEGHGVTQDKEKAFNLRLESCGYLPNHCADLGIQYETGEGVEKNPFKAVKFYHSGCIIMQEDKACNRLGIMYDDGRGVRRCIREAKQFYGMACDYGNNNGCNNYSKMKKNEKQ